MKLIVKVLQIQIHQFLIINNNQLLPTLPTTQSSHPPHPPFIIFDIHTKIFTKENSKYKIEKLEYLKRST